MDFSPCLEIFYKDKPFPERMRTIADLGFRWFEFWSSWNKDMDSILKAMKDTGLQLATFCTRFVSLTDKSKRGAYVAGVREATEVAKRTGCEVIISQVGAALKDVSRAHQKESIVAGLKECVPILKSSGKTLMIEPLNTLYDHAGYFLTRSDEAMEIIEAVGSPHVRLIFDIYHQQASEGNLIGNIRRCKDAISHVHIADCPGRHEIGTGEINYANVLAELQTLGYKGRAGIELFPLGDHTAALKHPLFHKS
jgi:hydroxypyruvate isomerase